MSENHESGERRIRKIFQESWPELESDKESAFHYTDESSLESIAKDGIRHFSEREPQDELTESQRQRLAFDIYCDEIAKKLGVKARRSKSVFLALPPNLDTSNWSRFGDVRLEVKVDPTVSYVFDRRLHSLGAIAYYKTPEGKRWLESDPQFQQGTKEREEVERILREEATNDWQYYIEQYFTEAIPLSKYLSLPEEERKNIQIAEVAVPSPIDPKFIRLAIQ